MLIEIKSDDISEIDVKPEIIESKVVENNHDQLVIAIPSPSAIETASDSFVFRRIPSIIDVESQIKQDYEDTLKNILAKTVNLKKNPKMLLHVGQLNYLLGDDEQAKKYLEIASDIGKDPYYSHEYGDLLIDIGDLSGALSLFSSMNLKYDLYANLRLAQLAVFNQEIDVASKHVSDALEIEFTNYKARMLDGALHLSKKQWERAIRSFKVASESNPTSSSLFLSMGAAYWRLNKHKKSISSLKKAVHINPLNEAAVIHLADVCHLTNSPESSLPSLKKYLDFNDANAAIQSRYARVNYIISIDANMPNLLEEAKQALKTQITLENSAQAHNNLGVINSRKHNHVEAKRNYITAISLSSGNISDSLLFWSNLTQSYLDSEEYEELLDTSNEIIDQIKISDISNYSIGKIVNHRLYSMYKLNRFSDSQNEAVDFYQYDVFDIPNRLKLLSHILFNSSCTTPNHDTFSEYKNKALELVTEINLLTYPNSTMLINNLIFGILKFDNVEDAKSLIQYLVKSRDTDPYAAATMGLYYLRINDFDLSKEYYKNSMSLTNNKLLKKQIRQRMYIELGRQLITNERYVDAKKYLKKALKKSYGMRYADKEARVLLQQMHR